MRIFVDFGDKQNKKNIRSEFRIFYGIFREFSPDLVLDSVFFTENVDETVNKLYETDSFRSKRDAGDQNINVQGKFVIAKNGTKHLVFSSSLYVSGFESIIRFLIFIHELTHLHNKLSFPKIDESNYTNGLYLYNLQSLFDEYFADRVSLSIINRICTKLYPQKEETLNNHILNGVEGYISILNSQKDYDFIKLEISKFRLHGDVEKFLRKINQKVNDITTLTTHLFAHIHEFPSLENWMEKISSHFVNENCIELMDFLKSKYEEKNYDLSDRINLSEEYFCSFGYRFEQRQTGPYCTVIDI